MALISASILLFLVMDPFGNTPFFLAVLKDIPEEKRQRIILRELLIAFFILAVFIFIGPQLIMLLQVSEAALRISGGIILFLIAIKLIFGGLGEMMSGIPEGEPLIVPLAVPSIAGPSAVATILILVGQQPDQRLKWLLALLLAWLGTAVILFVSLKLHRYIGDRELTALQRLMGLVLTTISVEMFLQGISLVLQKTV